MVDHKDLIFSSDILHRKGFIFIDGIEDRVKESLDFINSKYKNINQLKKSAEFIEYDISDAIISDFQQLRSVGFFPVTETEMELDHSIKHALIGSYKSAFADLRRALELIVISVYLTSDSCDAKSAIKWVLSKSDTPGFSKSLSVLVTNGRFKEFDETFEWKKRIQELYWLLSDYSHNKGQLKGYRQLNKTNHFISGTSVPTINEETLESFCDFYINTVSEIIVILALYNPMILVGVPLDEKFGLNGPFSGFFYEGQAELVHQLLPKDYKDYFKKLAESDVEIRSNLDYFETLPDLTEEDIKEQIKEDEKFNKRFNIKVNGKD